ncbi:MAG: prolyl oligopeptidase family serine peptidase [Candidatus Eisenbacteria bacterium]|nr:prolyl oligopeptidase family serine peptidase [Candidatus Eisenbacteria bacterium]
MFANRKRALSAVLLAALLAGVALYLASCGGGETKLIPRSVLMGNPEKARARLSPDGTMLAYIAPHEEVLNVWVRSVGEEDDRVVTSDDNRGIFRYFWSQDSGSIIYLQDRDGDENWRLYDVDLETDEVRDLTPYEGVQVRIVDSNKRHPDTLVIAMNKQDPRLHDVYRLDLTSGEATMVARNPGNIVGWVTDYDMKVRGAVAATPTGEMDLLVRESEEGSWEQLLTWSSEDNMSSSPVTFSKDGGSLLMVDSRNANAGRLVSLDLDTKELEIIAEDPKYDVSDIILHPDTYEVLAVSFTKDRAEWEVLDEDVADDFEAIEALDEGDFSVTSYDNDYDTWLLAFVDDDGPISYWIYERETDEGEFLFEHRTDLEQYTLTPMEPISFESRDGLTIHGYITFPPDKERRGLPMVLNVHGGPWHRDKWGYNPEAQWLANRGYICLQVNFRGSTGYGKEFLNAGNKEWGRKMQYDLVDAVNWAVDQGYADPDKVAIYGHSYGGYAALVGATFTPDLFACAISGMGPSNLMTFINSVPPYWTTMLEMMYKRIGDPRSEEELLRERSPLFRIDEIKIPMLIVQGANDVRVKKAESEQVVAAMEEKGLDVEYIVFEDEGHGFVKPENRLEFYAEAEEFLGRHLGGRYEPMDLES